MMVLGIVIFLILSVLLLCGVVLIVPMVTVGIVLYVLFLIGLLVGFSVRQKIKEKIDGDDSIVGFIE